MRLVKHNRLGNCTACVFECLHCGDENQCDVCHIHDEPRGECSRCNPCLPCQKSERKLTKSKKPRVSGA
jgi:hypothetical protein